MVKSSHIIKSVTFFGWSSEPKYDDDFDAAYETSKLIAQSGRTIVNGGGPGLMLASTLGAKTGRGNTQVVYYKPELTTMYEGQAALNVADQSFEEANYILRTKRLLELGDAYIVFNGGTGTISEFAMAWGIARLYFGHHKPLILYGSFWHNVIDAFKKNMKMRPEEFEVFTIVNSPQEALGAIEDYETKIRNHRHKHKNCVGPECEFVVYK